MTNSNDYGESAMGRCVEAMFAEAPNKLRDDPEAQASFLVGACCKRLTEIQHAERNSTPFVSKLKGLRLDQREIQQRLFPQVIAKAQAYGREYEATMAGLLECATDALHKTSDRWQLSPDEVSYFFALGYVLRPKLPGKGPNASDNERSES